MGYVDGIGRICVRNLILGVLGSAAALAFATPSLAQSTVTFNDGNGGLGTGETLLASFSPGSTGGVVCAGTGCVIQTGSNTLGADPAVGGMGDPYLSVLGQGTASFTFAGGLSQLGLDYGSADTYNFFQLLFAGGATQNFSGQNLITAGTADGNQSSPRTNGRLTFLANAGQSITGLNLSSGQNSLEIDNVGTIGAVPEPGTWAMMLFGFGAIGSSMRRRRRHSGIAATA